MKRRNKRRRREALHDGRVSDRAMINTSECKALLDDGEIDGIDRLILLVAIASGNTTMTLAELRAEVCGEALDAGGVAAAIRNREIIFR
jgi:hypothetical protein